MYERRSCAHYRTGLRRLWWTAGRSAERRRTVSCAPARDAGEIIVEEWRPGQAEIRGESPLICGRPAMIGWAPRMPGPYAHLTLVQLLRSRLAAGEFPELGAEARAAVARSTAFCELGAFGPDTSYFAMAQPGSARWGDLQHKGGAMRVLLLGARALRPVAPDERRRRLAWSTTPPAPRRPGRRARCWSRRPRRRRRAAPP